MNALPKTMKAVVYRGVNDLRVETMPVPRIASDELLVKVARLVFSRALDVRPLVTHEFPLEKTADAVALAAHPTADSLKVIVRQ